MSEVITLRLSAIIVNHEVRPRSSFPGMGMDKIQAYYPSLKAIATITTDAKRKRREPCH